MTQQFVDRLLLTTEICHRLSAILTSDELLTTAVTQIDTQLKYAHVAIFLVEGEDGYVYLRDASGEASAQLKARAYKLAIGPDSVVGWAAANRQLRVTYGPSADDLHFSHALLPDIRAEAALPLVANQQLLGVLAIQSHSATAFDGQEMQLVQNLAEQLAITLSNVYKYSAQAEQVDLFKRVQQLSVQLSDSQYDLNLVLDTVTRQGMAVLNVDGAGVWLPVIPNEIELAVAYNLNGQALRGRRLKADEGLPGQAFATGEMIVLSDYANWEGRSTEFKDIAVNAALGMPMIWRGEAIGVLVFTHSASGHIFSDSDIQVAQLLASQSAAAIENSRLLDEIQTRVTELYMLNYLSEAVSAQTELTELYKVVHDQIVATFGVNNIYIALYDAQRDLVEIPYMFENGELVHVEPFQLGPGLVSHIISTRKPLRIVENAAERVRELDALVIKETTHPESYLGAPIIIQDEIIGAIGLQDFERAHLFEASDEALLVTIARQVGLAVQNTRLLGQTTRRAQHLQAIAQIGQAIESIQSVDDLLETAVALIQERFDLYYVGLFLIDKQNEWAVLTVGTGDAGQRQLARNHRLEVGGNSMIGRATDTGEARIALDVGQEAIRFDNPDLPDTRSELALLLRSQNRIIGALSIQSARVLAFSEEDISTFQVLGDQIATALDGVRLLNEVQTRTKDLAALNRVTVATSSALGLQTMLQATASEMVNTFDALYVGIGLLDDSRSTIRVIYDRTASDSWIPGDDIQISIKEMPTLAKAVETAQPVYVRDLDQNPLIEKSRTAFRESDMYSMLAVPIVLRGKVLGIVSINFDQPDRTLTPREITLAESIAGQLAIALQNAQLFDQTGQRARYLQSIAAIGQAMAAILEIEELIQMAVNLIRDQFDLYYAGLFLNDKANEWAILRAGTGEAGQRQIARGHRLAVDGDSMIGQATGQGDARIALDVGQEAIRFDNPDLPDTRSELALPLRSRGQIIGALTIQSTRPSAFSQEDIEIFQLLADQIAVAVDNARLFQAEQQRRRASTALLELAQVASSSLELKELLQQIAQRTAQAVEANRTTILLSNENGILYPAMSQFADGHVEKEAWQLFRDTLTGEGIDEQIFYDVMQARAPRLIYDAMNSDEIAPEWTHPFNIHTLLIVPLVSRDKPIGLLSVDHDKPHADFTPEQVDLAVTIGSQMSVAIENTRLFAQTENALAEAEEQARRLAKLNVLNEQLSQATNLDEIIKVAAEHTQGIVQADRVSVAWITDDGEHLEVFALEGDTGAIPTGTTLPVAGTMAGAAVTDRRLMVAPDLTISEYLEAAPLAKQGLRAAMNVPLIAGEQVLGTLNVASTRVNAFTARDESLMIQIASVLAATIDNRNLFEQARKALAETEALYTASDRVVRATSIDEILQALIESTALQQLDRANVIFFDRPWAAERPKTATITAIWEKSGKEPNVPAGTTRVFERFGFPSFAKRDEPVIVDITTDDRIADDKRAFFLEQVGIQSLITFPLVAGGRWIGVITGQAKTASPLRDDDIRQISSLTDQAATVIQNQRLFAQTQASLAETQALYTSSGRLLSAEANLQEMLAAVLEGVQITAVNRALYFAFESNASGEVDAVVVAANWHSGRGTVPMPLGTRYLRIDLKLTAALLGTEPFFINDLEQSELLNEYERALFRRQNVHAVVGIPLWVGNSRLGALLIESEEPHQFTEQEIRPYLSLARQMAVVLNNIQLLEDSQNSLREVNALLSVTRQAGSLDLDEMLRTVLRSVFEVIPATQTGLIMLYNASTNQLDTVAAQGFADSALMETVSIAPDESVLGKVFSSGKTRAFNSAELAADDDVSPENAVIIQKATNAIPFVSAVIVTIRRGETAIGMMALNNSEMRDAFSAVDVRLAEGLAGQMSVAIENARLFQQTQRLAQRQRLISDIANKIRRSTDAEGVMNTTLNELQRVLGAKAARARLATAQELEESNGRDGDYT